MLEEKEQKCATAMEGPHGSERARLDGLWAAGRCARAREMVGSAQLAVCAFFFPEKLFSFSVLLQNHISFEF